MIAYDNHFFTDLLLQLILIVDILGEDVDAVQKEMNSILTAFNDDWEMVHDLKRAHQRSYIEYVRLITFFHEFCNYEKIHGI